MTKIDYKAYSSELLKRLAAPSLIENLIVLEDVDSTQRIGRAIQSVALDDDLDLTMTAVVAWNQTEGRGRHGRPWWSDPGSGVFASLTHRCEVEELALLPQIVSLALAEVVDRYCTEPVLLKWPNDLLVGGRKLAGVLVEALHRGASPCHAIVGFGVNHRSLRDRSQAERATSLSDFGSAPPGLPELAAELLESVAARLRPEGKSSPEEIVSTYRERLVHRAGDRLLCRVGDSELAGEFVGVDDDGRLRLRVGEVEHVLAAAELEEDASALDSDSEATDESKGSAS